MDPHSGGTLKEIVDIALKVVLLLWAAGFGLYKIFQGALFARLRLSLTATAHPTVTEEGTARNHALIVVSLVLTNIGRFNVNITGAAIEVQPSSGGHPTRLTGEHALKALEFDHVQNPFYLQRKDSTEQREDSIEPSERLKYEERPYRLVWGTEDARQLAFLLPRADYYEVKVRLAIRRAGGSYGEWRAACVVPWGPSFSTSPTLPGRDQKPQSDTESDAVIDRLLKPSEKPE